MSKEEVIPSKWSEEDKIKSIVKDIEEATFKKVSYTYYWYMPTTDKNKHWKITVEGHISTFEIPNIVLMGCGVRQVKQIAEKYIEEIKHWVNVTDKTVIDIKVGDYLK